MLNKTLIAVIGPDRNTHLVINKLKAQFVDDRFEIVWFTWNNEVNNKVTTKKISLNKPVKNLKGNGFICHSSKENIYLMFYSLCAVGHHAENYSRVIRLRSDTILSERAVTLLMQDTNVLSKSVQLPKAWYCDHLFSLEANQYRDMFNSIIRLEKVLKWTKYNPEMTLSVLLNKVNSKSILFRYCDFSLCESGVRDSDPEGYKSINRSIGLDDFIPACDLEFKKGLKAKFYNLIYNIFFMAANRCIIL